MMSPKKIYPLFILAIILLAVNMRSPLVAFGSLASIIQDDLQLSKTMIGLLGAIPMVAFSLGSIIAPKLSHRYGLEKIIIAICAILGLAIVGRVLGQTTIFLLGTIVVAMMIALANVLVPAVIKKYADNHLTLTTSAYAASLSLFAGVSAWVVMPMTNALASWRLSLGIWGLISFFAALLWLFLYHLWQKNGSDDKTLKPTLQPNMPNDKSPHLSQKNFCNTTAQINLTKNFSNANTPYPNLAQKFFKDTTQSPNPPLKNFIFYIVPFQPSQKIIFLRLKTKLAPKKFYNLKFHHLNPSLKSFAGMFYVKKTAENVYNHPLQDTNPPLKNFNGQNSSCKYPLKNFNDHLQGKNPYLQNFAVPFYVKNTPFKFCDGTLHNPNPPLKFFNGEFHPINLETKNFAGKLQGQNIATTYQDNSEKNSVLTDTHNDGNHQESNPTNKKSPSSVWQSRLAWWISGLMGLQSLLYYTMASFLSLLLQSRKLDGTTAGQVMFIMQCMALPSAFLVNAYIKANKSIRQLAMVASVCNILGVFGFSFLSTSLVWVMAVLVGGGCAVIFNLSLILFGLKTTDDKQCANLAGMVQAVGYALAFFGPFMVGLMLSWFGNFSQPMIFLLIILMIKCVCAYFATSDKMI